MANVRAKLVKSLTGRNDKHIATARSLGLRRIGDETTQPDNAATRGKLHQIRYLVTLLSEDAPAAKAVKAAPDAVPAAKKAAPKKETPTADAAPVADAEAKPVKKKAKPPADGE